MADHNVPDVDKLIGAIQVIAPVGTVEFVVKLGTSKFDAKPQSRVFGDAKKARRYAEKRTQAGHYWAVCQLETLLEHQVPMTDAHKLSI